MPAIGSVTPVGLIAVNVAEFIAQHLADFRWAITVLAFVSGTMLNSWVLLGIYAPWAERHPEHPLAREENREVVLIFGMLLVLVASGLTALFCYMGLANAHNLPNELTLLTAVIAIGLPFALRAFFEWYASRASAGKPGP